MKKAKAFRKLAMCGYTIAVISTTWLISAGWFNRAGIDLFSWEWQQGAMTILLVFGLFAGYISELASIEYQYPDEKESNDKP